MKSFITPVFVGRSKEVSQLDDALAAIQAGAGRCVLVSGDAGIGKSRLIAETEAKTRPRGFTTLVGRCFEQDRSFPYAPLIDMLRPFFAQGAGANLLDALGPLATEVPKLLPELASWIPTPRSTPPLDSAVEKRRLFEALTGLFLRQSQAGPLMLVVEDLHWSDEASLEFLLYLARRTADHPILLLLSHRIAEAGGWLVELLAGLDREPSAQEIRLDPLTRAEAAQLLKAILGQTQELSAEFVEAIYRLSEGNPFFAEEICTSLIASGEVYYADSRWQRKPLSQIELPDTVHRLVQRRLNGLGRPARRLIDLAAVSGRSFDFAVLQALTGHDDAELLVLMKELMAAQLAVEESADQFAFRHGLIREALYGRLLARERQELHAQLSQAIEQIHADSIDAHLEALAYHAFEAGIWPRALEYARRAGKRALSLYAPHAAAEHFARAIQAAAQLSQAVNVDLYRLRGQAFDTLGNFDRARADYEKALSAAQATSDQQAAWQALLDLGLLWASRDYERTGEYCRDALELARTMEDPATIGHSLNRLGNWLMNKGEPFEALDTHREALNLFEMLEDQAGVASTLDLLAMTSNMCGDYGGTISYYERAIPILRQLSDRQTLASSLTMLSNYTLDEAQVREALALTRETDWRAGEAFALVYLGSLLAYRGQYGQGLSATQRGLELAQAIDHRQWQAWGESILGLITLELLALDQASRHLQNSRALATEVGSSFMTTFASGLLASTYVLQNRLDEAARLLPDHLPRPLAGADFMLLKAMVEVIVVRREDPARALQLLERLALPKRPNWPGAMGYYYGSILRLRGETLARLNRPKEAEIDLQDALDLYEAERVRMGRWRIQLALGKLYQAGADSERAEAAFTATRTLIEEVAATLSDDGLGEDFRRQATALIPPAQPLTPSQATKQKFGRLTRREGQVAAMVAQGLSNREIADELVISVKTVEAHVTRILAKLGFYSRAQVAAWAVDKGLASAPQDLDSR
jgi:DNA-binding CsgD family transcriptional regulator/tetratricopeptide (TPR) repeat protein